MLPCAEPEARTVANVSHLELGVILVVVLALVLVVFSVIRAVHKRRLRPLQPIFEPGSFRLTGVIGVWADGSLDGYRCRYRISDPSKNSPGGALLDLAVTVPSPWRAARQNPVTRTLSKVGVLSDLEIGDLQLDDVLRFKAAHPDVLGSVFRVEGAREALRRLVSGVAFESADAKQGRLRVHWQPRRRGVDEDPETVRSRISEAIAVAVALSYPPALR
jgi:hypothetical protein